MPPWMNRTGAWARRHFAWSNSRRSWYERLGALALVGGAVGGWWVSRDWSGFSRIVLLCAWLLLLAVVFRRGAVRLLGPVFFLELLRGSRKRVHLFRTVYGGLLLLVIGYVYLLRAEFWDRLDDPGDIQAQSETAFTCFLAFFVIQLVVVAILTPVMIAGAIAEDKERRTLEFILATDLRNREIVLGKLGGRMASMAMFLVVGLPILSLLQLMGGIDPDLLLVSLVVTVLTFASVAAVSIWHSTMLRRGRDAIVMTYLAIVGYLAISGAAQALLLTDFGMWKVRLFGWLIYGKDVVDWFGAGNLFVHWGTLAEQLGRRNGGSLYDLIPGMVTEYAVFHLVVIIVGVAWSVLRLRAVALSQGVGEVRGRWRRVLPAIGRDPMLWKEIFAEPGMRLHWWLRLPIYLIVLLSFLPPVIITAEHWDRLTDPYLVEFAQQTDRGFYYTYQDSWYRYGREMNIWVRASSALVGSLLLLAVAARAAGSVSGERSRQTLDELLASPLTNSEIVSAKWLGSILGLRRGWAWLGMIYFVGLASGALNIVGALLAIAAWFCFAAFMASLGLWFSVQSRSSFKSGLATILTAMFVMGGHWIVTGLFCFLPMGQALGYLEFRDLSEWMAAMEAGVTPPAVLAFAPMHELKELTDIEDEIVKVPVFMVIGTIAFLVAAAILKSSAVTRLALVAGRTDVRRPERRAPAIATPPVANIPQPQSLPATQGCAEHS